MRRLVLLGCAAVLVGCAKKESQPAADTTAAVAPAPPPMLMMSDLAGKWHVKVMPETSDSVILEYDMVADSTMNWTMMLPKRTITGHAMLSGDSVVVDAGPYESVLRKGVQVTTHSVSRIQGGELVGMTTAHYATKKADSVAMLRTRGTRTP
ncbi:MAG TPA: hypothetical protein VGQ73_01910 [Gemmatimonadales bacterium]|nr:hypothetical protein [Gemmatimonadales bacterium]